MNKPKSKLGKIEAIGLKRICSDCIANGTLARHLKAKGKKRKCSFCGKKAKTKNLRWISKKVKKIVLEQFTPTPDQPDPDGLMSLEELKSTIWFRDGQSPAELIEEIVECSSDVASDLVAYLNLKTRDFSAEREGSESPFSDEICYEDQEINVARYHQLWDRFLFSINHQSHFSKIRALQALDVIFANVDSVECEEGASFVHHDKIKLFRARRVEPSKLKQILSDPVKELGPPPASIVGAGRMNAVGSPIFYGATEEATAIAEIRPPVGGTVVVATFETLEPVRFLDMVALRTAVGARDRFAKQHVESWERAYFLRQLSKLLTRPVIDAEDYLASQAVAEYFSDRQDIAGIIYPSAQNPDGKNVAFFHHSSKVASLTQRLTVSEDWVETGDDEWRKQYLLSEGGTLQTEIEQGDTRQPTLSLQIGTIKALSIDAVQHSFSLTADAQCG